MAQWSRPVAIPNQTSKTTAALAFIDSRLHMIHLGASSDQLWHSVWDSEKKQWSENVRMGKESSGRVSLAQDGLLVYQSKDIGSDGERGLVYSLYHGPWTPSKPLPDYPKTSDAPAAALVGINTWAVVRRVPRQDFQLRATHYILSATFPPSLVLVSDVVLNELSAKVPALVSHPTPHLNMVYLKEGSKNLWHSGFNIFAPIPNQASRDVPAMALHKGVLHMVHIGSGSDTIWHSTFNSDTKRWTDNVPIANHLSNKPPAMASAPDGLHMVHKGAGSDRIWHSIYS